MTQEIHTEAIVLTSFPYRDFDRIVTLFSPDRGIFKVIILGAQRPKSANLIFTQPLTHLFLTYKPKKGELHLFKEGKHISSSIDTRNSYDALCSALKLVDYTIKSQPNESPNAKLYSLFKSYLQKITTFKNPDTLALSYLMKILVFEGLWTIQINCSNCREPLDHFYYFSKAYFCSKCAPNRELVFELDEMHSMAKLVNERSYQALDEVLIAKSLSEKIEKLFLTIKSESF